MPRTQGPRDAAHDRQPRDTEARDARSGDEQEDHEAGGGSGSGGGSGGPVKSSHVIAEHIDVGVPRDVAYDQWTRYQDLPKYSKHESAESKRSDRVGFHSKIGPLSRGRDAQVVEQVPERRIAWRSIGGAQNMGVVTFHRLDDRLTRVMIEMEYHPSGFVETIGNVLRMQRRRVRKDLRLFKHFIELRGEATGKGAREAHEGGGLQQETDEHLGSNGNGNGKGNGASDGARADEGSAPQDGEASTRRAS